MASVVISDAAYRQILAKAAARKLSVDEDLEDIARREPDPAPDPAQQLAALLAYSDEMSAWTGKNLPSGPVVDDSRESIYCGRGE